MRRSLQERMALATGVSVLIGMSAVVTTASYYMEAAAAVQDARRGSLRKPSPRNIPVTPEMIGEAQQRLLDLGYWIGDADGKWGEASRHGLIAFQKVERRARTGKLAPDELEALRTATRPLPRERGFVHIEIDLQRQVLFVVDAEGTAAKILPVSTGNGKEFTSEEWTRPAVTPTGRFRVYRKLLGWRKSPLGLLYYPSYIVGGIAIHGNRSVPAQPASHGCIRIPMFAAEEFSVMTPIGTQVIVYDGSAPAPQSVAPPQRRKSLRAISRSSAQLSPTGLSLRPQNQPDKGAHGLQLFNTLG